MRYTTVNQGQLKKRLQSASRSAPVIFEAAAKEHVEGYVNFLRSRAFAAGLGLKALSPATLAAKRREGRKHVRTPMVADENLVRSVRKFRTKGGWRARPAGTHRRSGLTNERLFAIHAKGNKRLPRRNVLLRAAELYAASRERKSIMEKISRGLKKL